MSLSTLHAITLRSRPLGEHDRVVSLFTRERGLVRAAQRGARRPRNTWGISGESLVLARWWLARGRSLEAARQVEVLDAHGALRQDYERLMLALHALDALQSTVLEEEPHPDLFDRLLGVLKAFELASQPLLVAAWFEVHLTADLGYRPEFERCVRCEIEIPRGPCGFDATEGGVVCGPCQAFGQVPRLDGTVRRLLSRLQAVELPDIAEHELDRGLVIHSRQVLHGMLSARARLPWHVPAEPDLGPWKSSTTGYPPMEGNSPGRETHPGQEGVDGPGG